MQNFVCEMPAELLIDALSLSNVIISCLFFFSCGMNNHLCLILFVELFCLSLTTQLVQNSSSSTSKTSLVQMAPKKLRLSSDHEALTCATSPAGMHHSKTYTSQMPVFLTNFFFMVGNGHLCVKKRKKEKIRRLYSWHFHFFSFFFFFDDYDSLSLIQFL